MSVQADLFIVGGGPAGLAAAVTAAQKYPDKKIIILEKEAKCGRKILASGNGRCNISHDPVFAEDFFSHQPEKLAQLMGNFARDAEKKLLRTLGIPLKTDEAGRIYPYSEEAAAVKKAFEAALLRLGIILVTDCRVVSVKAADSGFVLLDSHGEHYESAALIWSCGGAAAPSLGGNDSASLLAASLGLQYFRQEPVLSPLVLNTKASFLKTAAGSRFKGTASVRDLSLAAEGEFLWTDYGLSGIAAMELSWKLAGQAKQISEKGEAVLERPLQLSLDFFPDLSAKDLAKAFSDKLRSSCCKTIGETLSGFLHSRLIAAMEKNGLLKSPSALSADKQLRSLAFMLKAFSLPIKAVRGFDQAQAACGGIGLEELDSCFRLKNKRNLALCGEALDAAGNTGGYNMFFALNSGIKAGESIFS